MVAATTAINSELPRELLKILATSRITKPMDERTDPVSGKWKACNAVPSEASAKPQKVPNSATYTSVDLFIGLTRISQY
jgi:hypothetical protein